MLLNELKQYLVKVVTPGSLQWNVIDAGTNKWRKRLAVCVCVCVQMDKILNIYCELLMRPKQNYRLLKCN